jgi:hypothetical protein
LDTFESELLRKAHIQTEPINSRLGELNNDDLDPCLRYLCALRLDQLLQRARSEINNTTGEIEASSELVTKAKQSLLSVENRSALLLRGIAKVFSFRR